MIIAVCYIGSFGRRKRGAKISFISSTKSSKSSRGSSPSLLRTKEVSVTDLKRPREEEDDNSTADVASMETDHSAPAANEEQTKEPACFSSVIPGWFSEMSPMRGTLFEG
ncbi:hypothetical protein Rs2_13308 [Raphanus sativus]|nr:hypothetical protein Rs2_13308 [Raphanus sativus]